MDVAMARRIVSFTLLLLCAIGHAADLPPVGRYQISVTLGAPGLIMEEVYASDECLTETDLVRGPEAYVARNPDEQRSCQVDDYQIGSAQVTMQLECIFGPTTAAIVGSGSYDGEGFVVDNDVKINVQGLEVDMKAVLTGIFVGECPAEE